MLNNFDKYNYIGLGGRMSATFFSTPSAELTQQNPNVDEIQISGVKLRKEQESAYQNNVYFKDPLNNAYVNVGLSDENLSKLKEVFGENAVKSEGNQILLKGKAEEFVSSWYADIAYKRGYIRADENNNGFLNVEELWQGKLTQYLDNVVGNEKKGECKGYVPPSFEEVFYALIETMEENKELVEEELQKANTSTIDLTTSAEEIFEEIIKQENGVEALNSIKERLENKEAEEQSNANSSGTQKENVSNSVTTQENSTTFFANEQDEATFNEMAKLTKLDKETLAYNLTNNRDFEENIISIVQELTQNVDKIYTLKISNLSSQQALDLKA